MMRYRQRLLMGAAALLAALFTTASCSMMEDDRRDCPSGLYVSFVYDYNIDRADMFRDQVGALTLYVFDEQGRLVTTRNLQRPQDGAPIATLYYQDDTRYQLHLPLPAGRYRLLALAQQRPYDELLNRPGAKFRRNADEPQDYREVGITLDRATTTAGTRRPVPHGGEPLDTLWHGMMRQYAIPDTALTTGTPLRQAELVEVQPERPTYATISLVRDMKELHVAMHATDEPDRSTLQADDYDISIVDCNGRLDWNNDVLADDSLLYTPYAQWTDRAVAAAPAAPSTRADGVVEQSAHYDFCLSRLIYSDVPARNAVMRIVHKPTQHVVAQLNLTHLLSQGRTHPQLLRYSPQEFLDREHRYNLNLVVVGTGDTQRLSYISLSISILGWAKRIQYEML